MKKTLLATMVLASLGMASAVMAAPATNTFQWSGNVPVVAPTGDFEIVQVGAVDFNSGSMKLSNAAGVVTLESSNEISFNVIESASGATPGAQASYTMTLESLKLGDNEQDPAALEIKVVADGVDLVRDVPSSLIVKSSRLKIAAATDTKIVDVVPGSLAVVQAIVKIAPAVI